jgi:hypothetical protein
MNPFDSRRSRHKPMIVVAGSLAIGTLMMATAAISFARGGGGGHFGSGHFAIRHFGGDFGRPSELGSDGLYYGDVSGYGDGHSGCYAPTSDDDAWACY